MIQQLFAPQLDTLIGHAKKQPAVIGKENRAALLRFFSQLQPIAACGEDERHELWIAAERGTLADFGDYEEYLDVGEVKTYEEFETLWQDYYPDPVKWYPLTTVVYQDYFSVFLDNELVLQITPDGERQNEYNKSELIAWLSTKADDCLALLKAGTYNDMIAQSLPERKRVGKILREDYWRVFPEEKAAYLKSITPEEIRSFTAMMQSSLPDTPPAQLPEMTVGLFLDCCCLGYEANNYEGVGQLSPRELYLAHADRRHDGLLDLPEDSAEAFADWKKNGEKGGHPWEVCRGGNSTHISLYVRRNENGWWLELAGSSHIRSVETIKFYLALMKSGPACGFYMTVRHLPR